MNQKFSSKATPRPYWHVDLKWIFGLMAVVALGAALLFFNLSNLTERDRAIKLSATIVASLFSKEGLDDSSGLAEFRQKAQSSPDETVTPIDQFPWLKISKEEALTLSPRDLRIAIFSQMTTPIYDKGLKGAAAQITQDPAEQEKFTQQASLLGVFTHSTHETLQRVFYVSAAAAIVLIVMAIYFSAGLGRLVTPGVLLLATSPLGTFAGLLLLHPPKDGESPFAKLPPGVAIEIGNSLSQSCAMASLLGLLLLALALVLKIAIRLRRVPDISRK